MGTRSWTVFRGAWRRGLIHKRAPTGKGFKPPAPLLQPILLFLDTGGAAGKRDGGLVASRLEVSAYPSDVPWTDRSRLSGGPLRP